MPRGYPPTVAHDENPKKRKVEQLHIFNEKSWSVHACINGLTINAIIYSGATISAVSKAFVSDAILDRRNITPIQVGSGETIFSMGETDLKINFGQKSIVQRALVIETNAFQAVLGMDFLSNVRIGGLITQPPLADFFLTERCIR